MNILVLNSGSSSIKFNFWDMKEEKIVCSGLIEKIGMKGSSMTYIRGKEKIVIEKAVENHTVGIQLAMETITDSEIGVVKDLKEINAVGHRVLHGGEKMTEPILITEEVKKTIEDCIVFGPLHNPPNLAGIIAMEKVLPGIPNVAVFDTGFHATIPPKAHIYPVPYEFYEKYKIKKYGFHGTSHKYVTMRTAEILGKKQEDLNCVTCHLGNGSSLAAIKHGKSVDTTMGLTPLAGLPMGTRCGDVDPSILIFMMENLGWDAKKIKNVCNKDSGFKGISGVSSDMRDLRAIAAVGNERAQLAIDIFTTAVKKYIAAFAVEIEEKIDAIVFTGGIGENVDVIREAICKGLELLGAKLDPAKNNGKRDEGTISTDDSLIKIMIVPTNEELMIARETELLVK